jgi:dipeptidyl aminopeptidase/acylaminoacyl peptidase
MIVRRAVVALGLAGAIGGAGASMGLAGAAPAHYSVDAFRRTVGIASPAISPDGKRVVVIASRVNWSDDSRTAQLDLIDAAAHTHRPLTYDRTGLADPAWSPDGTRLAFIADAGSGDDAKPQVFVLRMDGGDARQVTHAPDGVAQFAWRRDGEAFAYAASDPEPKRSGADRFRTAFSFTTEPITARAPARPLHLFVVAADGSGTARQLTHGSETITSGEAESTLSWSPDGTTIAILLAPSGILNESSRARITLVNVADGKLRRLTTFAGNEADPQFSPDGKHVAFGRSEGDSQITLVEAYVASPDAPGATSVSHPFDRMVDDIGWLPDSSGLLFRAFDGTSSVLVRAPLSGGAPTRVDLGELNLASSLANAIARDGTLAFVGSADTRPPEVYVRPATGGAPIELTDYNASIAALELAKAERITYPTSLGITGDAVLYRPPGFTAGAKYPLLLFIHGGPTSASTSAFSYGAQLFAARGWLVLQPNYRGSNNLGLAYQRAVYRDPEAGPGKDIIAALDAVRAMGIVDDRRLGVFGWSYGGIMTAWMISQYHHWKAAVSGASVNDWTTDYGTADDSDEDRALFAGSPFVRGNRAEWDRASSITYAAQVTTPLLILSDVGDNRDPFATSSMYYRALRDNHKDVTFIAYPVDGHFPTDPVRTMDVYQRAGDFIAQHFR